MILARRCALEWMKAKGIVPTNQILENKISTAYRHEIKQTIMTYQLVSIDNHRSNLVEKSIKTCNNHFIGVTSRTVEIFLAHLW